MPQTIQSLSKKVETEKRQETNNNLENINEEEIKENTINKNNDLAKVQDKEINPIKKKDIFIDYFEKKKKILFKTRI